MICPRCTKSIDGLGVHTCTPTPKWRELERKLEEATVRSNFNFEQYQEAHKLLEEEREKVEKMRELLASFRDDVLFRIGCNSPYRALAQGYYDQIKQELKEQGHGGFEQAAQ